MHPIMLAALLNTAIIVTPVAPARPLPISPVTVSLTASRADNEHLVRARQALDSGAYDIARREFVIAAALDRDAGLLPVDASFGLANVLFAQGYEREAALVLDQLADEALNRDEVDVAARALNDATWLHLQARRPAEARADGQRLASLLGDSRLSPAVRREVRARFR